jgi:hypothetical protein
MRERRLRAQMDPETRATVPPFDGPLFTGAQGAAIVAVDLVDKIYRDARGIPGAWLELEGAG